MAVVGVHNSIVADIEKKSQRAIHLHDNRRLWELIHRPARAAMRHVRESQKENTGAGSELRIKIYAKYRAYAPARKQ